jgi:drug/metabolite transporter (DMT)-like permease
VTVALVLVSAFFHALWNALLRLERDKDRALVGAIAAATVLATIVAAARWAACGVEPFPSLEALAWTLAAGVLEWRYFSSLARALDSGPLGPIYTISRGGSIMIVYPVSIALLGEQLDAWAAAGSGVVLVGLVLSGARIGDRRALGGRALAWAIACAVAIAGYHLAYKQALHAHAGTSAAFAVSLALASVINFIRVRGALAYARGRIVRVITMGLICGGSFLILMEALNAAGAGFVLTLRNTSVLFATGLGFAIRERPHRVQIVGAIAVAAGAILMAHT